MRGADCHPERQHRARGFCGPCLVEQWRKANPDKVRAAAQRYRARHREAAIKRDRPRFLATYYGITEDDYDAMMAAQGGMCAVCRRPETSMRAGRVRRLAVDHDHATGRVRGLLCRSCNMAVGMLGDSPERLTDAAAYLASHAPFLVVAA